MIVGRAPQRTPLLRSMCNAQTRKRWAFVMGACQGSHSACLMRCCAVCEHKVMANNFTHGHGVRIKHVQQFLCRLNIADARVCFVLCDGDQAQLFKLAYTQAHGPIGRTHHQRFQMHGTGFFVKQKAFGQQIILVSARWRAHEGQMLSLPHIHIRHGHQTSPHVGVLGQRV